MATIKANGLNQGDLVTLLTNAVTMCNELKADVNLLKDDVEAIRAAVVAITAQLDADAGVTDTDYASNNDPAAITATDVTTTDLSLTN